MGDQACQTWLEALSEQQSAPSRAWKPVSAMSGA